MFYIYIHLYLIQKIILATDRLKPVQLEEFNDHVTRMRTDRDKLFDLEYGVRLHLLFV